MCTAALLQRRNDCMQFRRQGDSRLPDIDADSNNHIIHSAIFTVPCCFCQNPTEFLPLIENIIHPLNLYRQLIQSFNRLCNGNCCTASHLLCHRHHQPFSQENREIQPCIDRRAKRSPHPSSSGRLPICCNYCSMYCISSRKLLTSSICGVDCGMCVQNSPQILRFQVWLHGSNGEQIGIRWNTVTLFWMRLNRHIRFCSECLNGFPDSCTADSEFLCKGFTGTICTGMLN